MNTNEHELLSFGLCLEARTAVHALAPVLAGAVNVVADVAANVAGR
jgi:hypothetical protein